MTDNQEQETKAEEGRGGPQADSTDSPQAELEELRQKIALCERERDEYLNGWRRAKADFVNYKNEEIARLEEVIKFGNEDIMRDVVVVLDSMERGVAVLETAGQAEAASGMRQIKAQLENAMRRRGLERMEVRRGDAFDSSRHEAIVEEEAETAPGAIARELECGYLLNGKVIRAAKVAIAKQRANSN